jgi:putative MATE family efflux protein
LVVAQVIVASALGIVTMRPLFGLLGASPSTIVLIESYMLPWFLGLPLLVVPMIANSAIRGTGDTMTPAVIMGLAGVVNLILDPFLIFGIGPFPRLELQGAAIATVFSWLVALVVALWFVGKKKRMLTLKPPSFQEAMTSWGQILYVALPAAATNIVMPLAGGLLTRLVASYGEEAVAAFGVGTRVESFATIGMVAMAFAITPFVGQNHGAHQIDRVRAALRFGIRFSVIWGVATAVVLGGGAGLLSRLFSDDPTVVYWSTRFLWIIPANYWAVGIFFIISASFNALNRPLTSSLLVMLRLFVFVVPLAFGGSMLFGLTGFLAGASFAGVLSAGLAVVVGRRVLRDIERDIDRRREDPPTTSKLEYLPG